jgi:Shikimate / quinate 5-dehydrogenase
VTSVLVVGLGETGVRTARQLLDTPGVDRVTVGARSAPRARAVAQALHDGAEAHVLDDEFTLPDGIDAIAAAVPPEADVALARAAVDRGIPYASVGDDPGAVRALLDLDSDARARGIRILVGCGLAPGLSDVLVHHAGALLDSVDEVHVARFGIGGPACAAVARRALREPNCEWRDGEFVQDRHRGDELIWFPDPVGARECALVATGVELLVGSTPGIERVTARLGLPPARRLPTPGPFSSRLRGGGAASFDATFGAMRAEVWGWRGPARDTVVYGVIERTTVAAGTVLGVATAWLAGALPEVGDRAPGASGLGTAVKPVPFLAELARRGVKAAVFEGVAIA